MQQAIATRSMSKPRCPKQFDSVCVITPSARTKRRRQKFCTAGLNNYINIGLFQPIKAVYQCGPDLKSPKVYHPCFSKCLIQVHNVSISLPSVF